MTDRNESGGRPLEYRITWRCSATTLHAFFIDFSTTAVFSRDPEAERDPLINEREVRRNLRRFMPRRILLRFHDAARKDLNSRTAGLRDSYRPAQT